MMKQAMFCAGDNKIMGIEKRDVRFKSRRNFLPVLQDGPEVFCQSAGNRLNALFQCRRLIPPKAIGIQAKEMLLCLHDVEKIANILYRILFVSAAFGCVLNL